LIKTFSESPVDCAGWRFSFFVHAELKKMNAAKARKAKRYSIKSILLNHCFNLNRRKDCRSTGISVLAHLMVMTYSAPPFRSVNDRPSSGSDRSRAMQGDDFAISSVPNPCGGACAVDLHKHFPISSLIRPD
jgi:hypothetical protein